MYVAPRVRLDDDPLFPLRMTCVVVIGLALAVFLRSPMPTIYPAVMFGMIAGLRGAYNPLRAPAGPILFSVAIWIMSGVVTLFWSLPLAFIAIAALIMFGAFYLAMKSSNPAALLLIMPLVIMSVLGLSNYQSMVMLRDEMTKAALFTALTAPVLFYLLPTRATWLDDPVYKPVLTDGLAARAAIRTLVLLLFCAWTYAVLGAGNMMLAMGASFALMFPTRETLIGEALERSHATVLGGAIGIAIMLVVDVIAQPLVFVGLVALATLYLSNKIATGRHAAMVYQFGASAMISVVTAAIGGQEPMYSLLTRVVLTFGGAIAAVFLVVLLEAMLLGNRPAHASQPDGPAPTLAAPGRG